MLNSSRFLAPCCNFNGTETGLRRLAGEQKQGPSGHLLRLEFPLGGWKDLSAPGLWALRLEGFVVVPTRSRSRACAFHISHPRGQKLAFLSQSTAGSENKLSFEGQALQCFLC